MLNVTKKPPVTLHSHTSLCLFHKALLFGNKIAIEVSNQN